MADPICRWRNATPENICEIVKYLPKTEISKDEFKSIMAKSIWGESFNTTGYQLACQTGLYYISEDGIYHPRFINNISIKEAERYLHAWFKKYYVPNPYTKKGFKNIEKPMYFENTLIELLNKEKSCETNFPSLLNKMFNDEIGELDILANLINRYSDFLRVTDNKILITMKDKYKMEINVDRNDKKAFFENFGVVNNSDDYVKNFSQTIYYGVPGSGKSNKIDKETENLPEEQKMRVVFHPEYTNADFVGQILPTNVDGNIEYKFKPGPLAKILRRSYLHPNKKYYLIIEEINRGNAAAIFGEYFQLLDRIDSGKEVSVTGYTYKEGWSSYSIENEFINWYIRENLYTDEKHRLENEDDGIAKKSQDETQKSIEIGNLHFSANTGIRLPPNLSLLATMNTSDQNVFVLDNAFQRRWNMCLVPNKFPEENEPGSAIENQRNAIFEGSLVAWETFQTKINQTIAQASKDSGFSSMVDKRLGCWFVKAEKNDEDKFVIKEEAFKNKILKYLWDDAFKFDRENYFVDADSFEDLQSKVSMSEKNFGVFKEIEFTENSFKTEEKLESTD